MSYRDHSDQTAQGWDRSILEVLERTNQATAAELAAALETHPMTIERQCRLLQREGYVRRGIAGTYTLAEEGQRRAESLAAD